MPSGVYKRIPGKSYGMFGKKHTLNSKEKMSKIHLGKTPWLGKKHKEISKVKMSLIQTGRPRTEKTKNKLKESMKGINTWMKGKKLSEETKQKMSNSRMGEKHPRWIKNRIEYLKLNRKDITEYYRWNKSCKQRDDSRCKIFNKDCKGQLEVHHILNWVDYPELRYNINNGITLCHFHHPLGRKKEQEMVELFKRLINNNKLEYIYGKI